MVVIMLIDMSTSTTKMITVIQTMRMSITTYDDQDQYHDHDYVCMVVMTRTTAMPMSVR